jgi:hypothetical protein
MMYFAVCLLTLSVLLGTGCTYRAERLPAPEEFSKSPHVLIAEYPALAPIFPAYSASGAFGMAYAEEFRKAWGEPHRTRLSWWNLWPGNWLFVPQYLWWWQLADKQVQCRIDHPIYTGFRKTVCNCIFVDAD